MQRKRVARRHGGFLPLIPLLAAAIPGILGTVAGALDVADKAKKLKGGRIRRAVRHRGGKLRKHRAQRKRGRGVVGDFVSRIPLLGGILGPIANGIGLGLGNLPYDNVHMKYGGSLMPLGAYRSMHGGLLSAAGGKVGGRVRRRGHYRVAKKGGALKRIHVRGHLMRKH
jgi:hypothetical protein